MKIGIG